MSLVNDMLRDLDARRSQVEGSSPMHLTPAPDGLRQSALSPVLFGVLGVALALAAVVVFWWLRTSGESTQDLNIRVPQVAAPTTAPAAELEGISEPAVVTAPVVAEPAATPTAPQVAAPPAAPLAVPVQQAPVQANVEPVAEPPRQPDSPAQDSTAVTPSQAVAAPAPRADNESAVSLDSAGGESVKDAAQLTPAEADTLAVQEALGLIAENRLGEAYLALEQHIDENRYAHRSRETYAKLLLSQGDLQSAAYLVDSGLDLAPNHPGFKKAKARILISQRRIEEAADLLLSRAPAVAEDMEYHELLASVQLATQDFEGALISYTGLVQHDQSQGRFWYGFAASQDSLGNSQAARQGYAQAMQLANLSPSLRRRSQDRLSVLSQ